MTIGHPQADGKRSRFLHVCERDASYPRDGDGCPTATGREWLVSIDAVAAVEMAPDRGGSVDTTIYVRGLKQPIRCCEDGEDVMAALGMQGQPIARVLDQLERERSEAAGQATR